MQEIFWTDGQITIRPLTQRDYDAYVAGFTNCLPAKNQFDEGWFDTSFMTLAWYSDLLQRRRREAERDESYMLHMFRNSDGLSIGECDITPHRRECFQYARIGYTVYNPHWGRGYATACAKGLIQIGFDTLGLHRLEAHVNLENAASERVLEKAGFSFEGIRKGFLLENGQWTDQKIYFINNGHWKAVI